MKYLVVGLGNIGAEYAPTRHNIGFMVVDHLAEQLGTSWEPGRYADTALAKHKGKRLQLIKPTTYMNHSGKAVRYYLQQLNLEHDRLLVITDDLALPFGRLRLRPKGSDGGHNGLKSINELLGSQQYPRLRVGIGDEFHRGQQVDYVLSPFREEEREHLPELIQRCAQGVLDFATIGIGRTMEALNRKKS